MKHDTHRWVHGGLVLLLTLWIGALPAGAVKKTYSVAAVGDCLLSSRVSLLPDARFLKLVDILRRADCAYGNCETALFHAGEGFPAYKTMDPNVFCEPWGADEFKWLGLDIMSLANNHVMDFSFAGLFSTLQNLERVGIQTAGAGADLGRASRAGYVDTAAGMVALVSCTSWIPEKEHQASPGHAHMKGRPGFNPLNAKFVVRLGGTVFGDLRDVFARIGREMGQTIPDEAVQKQKEIAVGEFTAVPAEKTEEALLPDERDVARILQEIRIARQNARLVMVALHEHNGLDRQSRPTQFQEEFARQCIDAGADLFFGTGPHAMWGIELYKGKAIFHSLGNFFFQEVRLISPEAYQRFGMPADSTDPMAFNAKFDEFFRDDIYWQSFVPLITFDGDNRLSEIKLYPLVIDRHEPLYQRGVPGLAEGEQAAAVLDRLGELSRRFNTILTVQNGVGTVQLPPAGKR